MQSQARDARYRLIADWAHKTDVETVALGHTRDDQAENFLIRLARQSGVDGLATMPDQFSRHGINWMRPLLRLHRSELRDFLTRYGVAWVNDPSNEDEAFDRVRARKILRALEPLGVTAATLAKVSENMSSARFSLQHYTNVEAERVVAQDRGDVLIPEHTVPPMPPEIQRRLLVGALKWVGQGRYGPRKTALVETGLAFAHGATRHTLAGCVITKKNKGLRICREYSAIRDLTCATDQIWDHRWRFDGPHSPDLYVAALGEAGLKLRPDWRDSGLPRVSLLATPAIWCGEDLHAAPLLSGDSQDAGWTAQIADGFHNFLSRM